MNVLLIGPYPPPHGGISVHVLGIHRALTASGVRCQVLDPHHCGSTAEFAKRLRRFASDGWTIHLHANGHNFKSWILALICGRLGAAGGRHPILTVHSGLAPSYLQAGLLRRRIASWACGFYNQIICVSPAIQQAVAALGIQSNRTVISPAYLEPEVPQHSLDPFLRAWIARHRPLFSTTVFFRPEYGVRHLISAMASLRRNHPSLGCLVMGDGEGREEAMRQIRRAGLDENVLLLGDVEHSRCLDLISDCDVFLRPTLQDGDSVSVREALSLAVPVVASRVGNRPDGVFLFEPGNVEDLIHAIETALTSHQSGPTPATHFMDRLMEIYRQSSGRETACA